MGATHQIRGHNRINTLRLQHHATRHRIDEHLLNRDVGKLLRDLRGDLIPKHHPIALRIALRHDGEMLARPLLRDLEREPDDALDAVAREDRDFGGRLPRVAAV